MSLQTARPPSPTCTSSLAPSLNFNHLPRPRKPRDTKPKMRKLKYHQYIPPDQRGGSGTGGSNTLLSYVASQSLNVSDPKQLFMSRRSQTEEPSFYPVFRPSLLPSPEAAAGHPPAANPTEPAATTAAATATTTATAHCGAQVSKQISADTVSD